ncbi:MAG: NAD-dependent epimerase/dehydratase family protein [Nitrospirae bacterium]|nr:MAG: NAD-dependent epimerase/dehydratase family protein [Nitrospirota bacterium]
MNVVITGGTGFIGSRLALRCLEMGHAVRVLGQKNNSSEADNSLLLENAGAKMFEASVTDRRAVQDILKGADLVVHLAAVQHEMNVPDQKFWDVNVAGTRQMLEASLHAGVKRFIHGSTIGVYGTALQGNVHENSPVQPDNIYGVTKLEGEKVVASFQHKLPSVIIRISETYGPGDRRLLKLFRAIKKKMFLMIGSGENLHHLIYIDDLIDGLLLAAREQRAIGQTFVLAGKDVLTTREMVLAIARYFGVSLPRVHAPLWFFWALATMLELSLRPLGIQPPLHRRRMDFFRKSFMFSQDHARTRLGFIPRVGFAQGAALTAQWYEQMGLL